MKIIPKNKGMVEEEAATCSRTEAENPRKKYGRRSLPRVDIHIWMVAVLLCPTGWGRSSLRCAPLRCWRKPPVGKRHAPGGSVAETPWRWVPLDVLLPASLQPGDQDRILEPGWIPLPSPVSLVRPLLTKCIPVYAGKGKVLLSQAGRWRVNVKLRGKNW